MTSVVEVLAGESQRMQELMALFRRSEFQKDVNGADDFPVFIVGNFNCPSHLDYTEDTKHLHQDWVINWPVTQTLEQLGFVDSYRQAHPYPLPSPGLTWSPIYGQPWPQDRIDFILHKGKPVKTVNSYAYTGKEAPKPHPDHKESPWPSDHAAVYSEIKFVG